MDGVAVEARDDVLAEGGDRLEGDLLRLRRGEDAEDELVAADVGVELHAARALVGRAHDTGARGDALLELLGGGLGDQRWPRRHAGGTGEGVEVPEDEARVVSG